MTEQRDWDDMQMASLFSTPAGEAALNAMERMLGVGITLEPAQEASIKTGKYHPICPIEMAIGKGRRDAYYLVKNAVARGKHIMQLRAEAAMKEEGDEPGSAPA